MLAGPGSGKTRVLTQRVAHLIANEGVRPWQMLAVTFTNKAAREMETRVRTMLGDLATDGLWLGTFHATCAKLLRREAENLPFESNFVIFDDDDGLASANRLMVECERGDIDQHAAPDIQAARNEIVELRARIESAEDHARTLEEETLIVIAHKEKIIENYRATVAEQAQRIAALEAELKTYQRRAALRQ